MWSGRGWRGGQVSDLVGGAHPLQNKGCWSGVAGRALLGSSHGRGSLNGPESTPLGVIDTTSSKAKVMSDAVSWI